MAIKHNLIGEPVFKVGPFQFTGAILAFLPGLNISHFRGHDKSTIAYVPYQFKLPLDVTQICLSIHRSGYFSGESSSCESITAEQPQTQWVSTQDLQEIICLSPSPYFSFPGPSIDSLIYQLHGNLSSTFSSLNVRIYVIFVHLHADGNWSSALAINIEMCNIVFFISDLILLQYRFASSSSISL